MKKVAFNKFLSFLLVFSLLISSTALLASAKTVDGSNGESYEIANHEYSDAYLDYLDELDNGLVVDSNTYVPYPYAFKATDVQNVSESISPKGYGSKYDPRPAGLVSSIKNQNPWGTCWAMSAISSLESFLINTGMENNQIDLSEEHLVWWAMKQDDGYGWNKTNKDEGGQSITVAGYFSSWQGPKSEADIPYDTSPELRRPANFDTAKTLYNVSDIVYVNSKKDSIKSAIKQYGAVSSMYCHVSKGLSANEKSFCLKHSKDIENDCFHAISVVGWDDNYSRHHFAPENMPSSNGAWLIKNSWSERFGDEGYMWISYEDCCLLKYAGANVNYSIGDAKKPDPNQKLYQLNPYGAVSTTSLVSGNLPVYDMTVANVFDFEEDQRTLDSVMFMCDEVGQSYEIYYSPVVDGKPLTDTHKMIPLASGQVNHSGYTTVPVDSPVTVPAGKGAIVMKLDNRANSRSASIGSEEDIIYRISRYKVEVNFLALGTYDQSYYLFDTGAVDAKDFNDGRALNFTIKAITHR